LKPNEQKQNIKDRWRGWNHPGGGDLWLGMHNNKNRTFGEERPDRI
jgi:hypothetical protein